MSNILKHANYLKQYWNLSRPEVSLRFIGNKLPRSDARHVNSWTDEPLSRTFLLSWNIQISLFYEHFNPSYTKLFRTHTLYQGGGGGGGGHLDPPTISSTLDCTNLKFCKVLDIPFKVSENTRFVKNLKFCKVLDIPFKISENTRFVKNLLYGYHGNCLITWCFSLIIVKTSMKNRYFSNAPRNHKLC